MGLSQLVDREPVRRLALREAILLTDETTVGEAVRLMRLKRLGCVIIAGEDRKPTGIFTEKELLGLLGTANAMEQPVGPYKSTRFASVTEDDPIEDVIDAMQTFDERFVVVVDVDGCVKSLTGQKGLMEYIADYFPWQVAVQRVGIETSTKREGA